MLTAHFVGNHKEDTLPVRAGWALTRIVQTGPYERVTHSESILKLHNDGSVHIGSSSARDGGVRRKDAVLNPLHWIIIDVPSWNVQLAQAWYDDPKNETQVYGWLSAAAAGLPFLPQGGGIFCNQAVGAPFLEDSSLFTPAEFACICASFGKNVTKEFFRERADLKVTFESLIG